MKLKSTNFMMILAAFLVVVLGIMGYVIYAQDQTLKSMDKSTFFLSKQSASDEISEIESDIQDTDLSELDNELDDIEKEIDSVN